jgi:CheY-like chemotaxis protein
MASMCSSGYEVGKKRLPVPVVVFSSSALPMDKEKAERLGAHDYLVKPDNFDSWILVAKRLHEQWLDSGQAAARTELE